MTTTRWGFLSALLGFGALTKGQAGKPKAESTFYITGFYHRKDFNDCTVPPIISHGVDRLDALQRCCENGGLTVWTETEWKEFRARAGQEFDAECKAHYGKDVPK